MTTPTQPRFKADDRVIYHGTDDVLLGETGTVVRFDDTAWGPRCMVRLDMGDLLDGSAQAFSHTAPPDTVARARRVLADRSSSQDALRGALRLLLAHVEQAGGVR